MTVWNPAIHSSFCVAILDALNGSCEIFMTPDFLTIPFAAPQWGHMVTFLQAERTAF
jgi:hypothetical protein